MFNNIFENAVRHGFTDKTKKYKFLIEVRFDTELSKTVISFSNNGNPFPKGMAERYCLKGEKAGPNAKRGYGTWVTCEIAKHFYGKIVAHDHKGAEFPVRIDLIINNLILIGVL
jgi:sensor histidine kinase regulating citrate/malate metabolism